MTAEKRKIFEIEITLENPLKKHLCAEGGSSDGTEYDIFIQIGKNKMRYGTLCHTEKPIYDNHYFFLLDKVGDAVDYLSGKTLEGIEKQILQKIIFR